MEIYALRFDRTLAKFYSRGRKRMKFYSCMVRDSYQFYPILMIFQALYNTWLMVLIGAMVYFNCGKMCNTLHLVNDVLLNSPCPLPLSFALLNRTPISHLIQNLIPFHDQPLAICILYALNSVSNAFF